MPNTITRGRGVFGEVETSRLILGGGEFPVPGGNAWFVDGATGGSAKSGKSWKYAKATIQQAVNAANQGDRIYIKPLEAESASGDTDPDSYAENVDIPAGKDGLSLIGVSRGLAQGAQPQIKKGSGSTAQIAVDAFGVLIHNLTINGAGATGGGILINANGSTEDAGGLVVSRCHIKNCKGSAAGLTGGGVYWSSNGGAWYVSIVDCEFIDCRAGIVMPGTSQSVPQHVKILRNVFSVDPNTDNDADILVAADGIKNLIVDSCVFGTVDVPGYATSPSAARYIKLGAGTTGIISNCVFACISEGGSAKTFGAAGDAVIAPTTVRMVRCYGESATVDTSGEIFRT